MTLVRDALLVCALVAVALLAWVCRTLVAWVRLHEAQHDAAARLTRSRANLLAALGPLREDWEPAPGTVTPTQHSQHPQHAVPATQSGRRTEATAAHARGGGRG